MTETTYSAVAAAAKHFEDKGENPTVRLVRKYLGGDNNKVNHLFGKWRDTRDAVAKSEVRVDPAIDELIIHQIQTVAAQASAAFEARANAAEEALDALAGRVSEFDMLLIARADEVDAMQSLLLRHQGQLQERSREIEEFRIQSAAAIKDVNERSSAAIEEANQRASKERAEAEVLRQDLVRSKIRLEAVPGIEASIHNLQGQLKDTEDEMARARQAEAVANSRADAQLKRADEAIAREVELQSQLQRVREDREKALDSERAAQKVVQQQLIAIKSSEARVRSQWAELEKLRRTRC